MEVHAVDAGDGGDGSEDSDHHAEDLHRLVHPVVGRREVGAHQVLRVVPVDVDHLDELEQVVVAVAEVVAVLRLRDDLAAPDEVGEGVALVPD